MSCWDAKRTAQGKWGLPEASDAEKRVVVKGSVGPAVAGVRRVKVVGKVRRG